MHSLKVALFTAIACLASFLVAYGVMYPSVTLHSAGAVKAVGVGVYWDPMGSQAVTSIDWGLVSPGAIKNVTVYIRNEGNAPITLSMQTANWNPANAPNYINLSWNYLGQILASNAIIPVTFSLKISPQIQGINSFTFDITIYASD